MSSLIAMPLAGMAAAQEARSALPDAQVVPYVEEVPVFRGAREGIARVLRYLADMVAPRRPWVTSTCVE